MDVLQRDDLPFPRVASMSFGMLLPVEAKCAAYMEKARSDEQLRLSGLRMGAGDPYFASPLVTGVLRCRKCRHDTGLTAGTVMERSHMPLSTWF